MSVLNLPVSSAEHRSRPASSARLVNCHAELTPPGAKTPVLITRGPGIVSWTAVGTGPIKAMYADVDYVDRTIKRLYVVSGHELYIVTTDGVPTLIGSIGEVPSNVDMAANTVGLCVVNEPRAFTYDGTTFGEIIDDDFVTRGAGDVEFLDNYLLFREPNSGRFFGADTGSLTSFNALQFAIADNNPDDLTGMIADSRQLVTFGAKISEIFENTGVSGFPFERNINGTIESGCTNGKTIARQDTIVFWLADDFTVRRLEGITPVRVSTHEVEQSISAATLASAFAFTYEQDGHFFYVLTFDEVTWVFDITTGEWHERQSYNNANWRISCHAQFNGLELVGDMDGNKIGYLSPTFFYDWGPYTKNLLNGSNFFTNVSGWSPFGNAVITSNYAVGPSGAIAATRIIDDVAGGTSPTVAVSQLITAKASSEVIVYAIAAPDQLNWLAIEARLFRSNSNNDPEVYFDLANVAQGTALGDVDDSGIVTDKNGFSLCWLKFTTTSDNVGSITIHAADADNDKTVALDGTSSILLAHAQAEVQPARTPPVETVSGFGLPGIRWGVQRMEWTYQTVYAEQQKAFHDRLEVVLEMGVGTTTGQGVDPKIMCSYSDDGGKTWRALEDKSLGALGKREVRAVWYGLGSARQRVYRMAVSDPVAITVTDTILEVRGGRL